MKIFNLHLYKYPFFSLAFYCLSLILAINSQLKGETKNRSYGTWFGPAIGVGIISGDDFLTEGLHMGPTLGVKGGIASSGDDNLRLQGNLGLYHSRIDVDADKQMFQPGEDTPSYIATTYGEAEFIAAYQSRGFSIGPLASLAFGTDTSFAPDVDEGASPSLFVGVEIKHLRDLNPKLLHSWSLSALVDANIAERDVIFVRLSYEFGKPLSRDPEPKPKTIVKVKVKEKKVIKFKTKYRDRIKTVVKVKPQYIVDAGVINFATDKYDLAPNTKDYISALASYLRSNLKRWDQLKIKAYTDKRGTFTYNEELARKRGEAVSSILMKAGLPKKRIKSIVKTFEQPVESGDSPIALARNRRVELSISGKNEMDPIKQNILLLQQKYRVPHTCMQNECK